VAAREVSEITLTFNPNRLVISSGVYALRVINTTAKFTWLLYCATRDLKCGILNFEQGQSGLKKCKKTGLLALKPNEAGKAIEVPLLTS
jgi:hypothetical protein